MDGVVDYYAVDGGVGVGEDDGVFDAVFGDLGEGVGEAAGWEWYVSLGVCHGCGFL